MEDTKGIAFLELRIVRPESRQMLRGRVFLKERRLGSLWAGSISWSDGTCYFFKVLDGF